jgi:hypothetical protein
MSWIATVKILACAMLQGAGPAALTERIRPVTSAQLKWSAAPVIGLVPTVPAMRDAGTFCIPDFERISKRAADRRSTGAGLAAYVAVAQVNPANTNGTNAAFKLSRFCHIMTIPPNFASDIIDLMQPGERLGNYSASVTGESFTGTVM